MERMPARSVSRRDRRAWLTRADELAVSGELVHEGSELKTFQARVHAYTDMDTDRYVDAEYPYAAAVVDRVEAFRAQLIADEGDEFYKTPPPPKQASSSGLQRSTMPPPPPPSTTAASSLKAGATSSTSSNSKGSRKCAGTASAGSKPAPAKKTATTTTTASATQRGVAPPATTQDRTRAQAAQRRAWGGGVRQDASLFEPWELDQQVIACHLVSARAVEPGRRLMSPSPPARSARRATTAAQRTAPSGCGARCASDAR